MKMNAETKADTDPCISLMASFTGQSMIKQGWGNKLNSMEHKPHKIPCHLCGIHNSILVPAQTGALNTFFVTIAGLDHLFSAVIGRLPVLYIFYI